MGTGRLDEMESDGEVLKGGLPTAVESEEWFLQVSVAGRFNAALDAAIRRPGKPERTRTVYDLENGA